METRASIDEAALANVMTLALELHRRIKGSPVPRAESLLTMPGVMRQAPADPAPERDTASAAVQAGFAEALDALVAARAGEGGSAGRCLVQPTGRHRPPARPGRGRGRRSTGRAPGPGDGNVAGAAA